MTIQKALTVITSLTDEEADEVTASLIRRQVAKYPNGYYPFPVFVALQAAVPHSAFELVCMQRNPEKVGDKQILLTQYDGDHEPWKGKWNIPGGYVKLAHEDAFDVCTKIALREIAGGSDELMSCIVIGCPIHVHYWSQDDGHAWGRPVSVYRQVFVNTTFPERKDARFFSFSELPEMTVPEVQARFILETLPGLIRTGHARL